MDTLHEKQQALDRLLRGYGHVAIAFSSGVDSTFLLSEAVRVLGSGNVLAVTAVSGSFPQREFHESEAFCSAHGIRQELVRIHEMDIPRFRENPPDRCYLCKKQIFTSLMEAAARHGIPTVAEGTNTDDEGDYRPGLVAIAELGVRSPLREAGLCKQDIRALSRELGLPTWSKPAYACLATRFPYHETITAEKLQMGDRAEQFFFDRGFPQIRVRVHGNLARIEALPEDMERLFLMRAEASEALKEIGFAYVSMDLAGYRTGSMNEVLTAEEKASATKGASR